MPVGSGGASSSWGCQEARDDNESDDESVVMEDSRPGEIRYGRAESDITDMGHRSLMMFGDIDHEEGDQPINKVFGSAEWNSRHNNTVSKGEWKFRTDGFQTPSAFGFENLNFGHNN